MNRALVATSGLIAALTVVTVGCSSAPKKQAAAKPPTVKAVSLDPKDKSAEAAPKSTVEAANEPTVTCVYGSTKREISVLVKDGGCTVTYAKDGNTSEIATGSATSSKCADVQKVVRGNLEKAGYTCQ
jgi:hypothetical protein